MRVYIHQGHNNGSDSGEVGADGFKESEFTRLTGEKLAELLQGAGHEAFLSRERLPNAKSPEVAQDANAVGVDAVVSIHANGVDGDPEASGGEAFVVMSSVHALALASDFADCFQRAFPNRKWRGVKPDTDSAVGHLAILRETRAPAFLVEPGFLSNPDELTWLESDIGQWQVAQTICEAIVG